MLSFLASFTILSIIAFSQTVDECFYGYFTLDTDGCAYKCYTIDNSNPPIPTSTLSFADIADLSDDVKKAIAQYGTGSCSSLDDLVWSTNCSPYCKCTDPAADIISTKTYFEQTCTECSCETQDYTNNIKGRDCNQRYSVNTVSQWTDYTCADPVIKCTDGPVPGGDRYPGDGYWVSSSYIAVNDPACQTYCYCNFDGTTDCETTYANILSSTNTDLTNTFKNDCEYYAAGCFEETTLMFSDSSYCSCPRCNCPSGSTNNGDTFYKEYAFPTVSFDASSGDSGGDTRCMTCECTDTDLTGTAPNLQQDCDEWGFDETYVRGAETCPPQAQGTCMKGDGTTRFSNDANNGVGLVQQTCHGEVNQHCGWFYQELDVDSRYSWDCQNSLFCQAFLPNGDGCIHLNIDGTLFTTSCDNNGFISNLDQYTRCCSGNNCNTQDIDITQCTSDATVNQWYSTFLECKYGSLFEEFFCTEVDTYSCEDIKRLGTWYFGCDCTAFADIYVGASSSMQSYLQQDIASRFSALDDWNTQFGCGTVSYTCDLTSGDVSINGQIQNPVTVSPTKDPTTALPTTGTPTQDTNPPSPAPSGVPTSTTNTPTTKIPTQTTDNPSAAPTGDQCVFIEVVEPWFQEIETALCDFCYLEGATRICSRMVDVIEQTVIWEEFIEGCFLEFCKLDCTFDEVGIAAGANPTQDCDCNIFDCNGGIGSRSGANELKVFVAIGIGFIAVMRLWM